MRKTITDFKTYNGFLRRYTRRFIDERAEERRTLVAPAPHRPKPATWQDNRLTVAWLGHATLLINFYGTWLLTDPALRSRVGVRLPGVTLGPRRLVEPALRPHELPPLDGILISHAHMDHCDLPTLARLPRRAHAVVQQGNRDLVRRFRCTSELAWGEHTEVKGVRIEAIPVSHWGARTLTDSGRGYGGFLLQKNDRTIVFGGDTAYTPAFGRLRERAKIDLAVLPIGAYNPYIAVHASPEQAWQMSGEMNADYLLPIHHATFKLSREPVDEPIKRLLAASDEERRRIALTEVGQTWLLPE